MRMGNDDAVHAAAFAQLRHRLRGDQADAFPHEVAGRGR